MDCLEQKEFLQWNTRTKDNLGANFQDIWLSSKSWILNIKYTISTIKMQISNQFFLQKDSPYCCYMCAKCILSSVLWDNFLWMTLYLKSPCRIISFHIISYANEHRPRPRVNTASTHRRRDVKAVYQLSVKKTYFPICQFISVSPRFYYNKVPSY